MTQKPALRTPVFVKIQDLVKGPSGYNVYVKVLTAEKKEVNTWDGQKITLVNAVVADETGSAKAIFKGEHAKIVKEGAILAIRNGVKKIIKGYISLELDIFGRVSEEKVAINCSNNIKNISDEEIKRQPKENKRNEERRPFNRKNRREHSESDRKGNRKNRDNHQENKRDNRDRQTRRNDDRNRDDRDFNRTNDKIRKENNRNYDKGNDREYDRPRGRYQYERKYEEKRENRRPLVKINKIEPGQENFSFIAKIISSTLVGKNLRLVLGDETGITNAFLRQDDLLLVGKSIILFGASANVVKEHIEIQKGRVELSRKSIGKIDESFNLSEKAWIPIEEN